MHPKSFPSPSRFASNSFRYGGHSLLLIATFCISAQPLSAEVVPTGLTVTHNNYARAVSGSDHEVGFTLSNFDAESVFFNLSATGNLTPPTGFGGVSSPISAGIPVTQQPWSFKADTTGAAGTSISVGMTATEVLPGTRTATSSFDLQLLENRTIGFSLATADGTKTSVNGVLDLGRYIGSSEYRQFNTATNTYDSTPYSTWAHSKSLNLTFSGGDQARSLATDVDWNPALLDGANAYGVSFKDTNGQSAALYYGKNYPPTQSATKTFDGAGQSHSVGLSLNQVGTFSKTVDFATTAHLEKGFTPESVSGSAISGAEVKFQNSEITIQGTSISNRSIFATSASGNGVTSNGVNVYNYGSQPGRFDTDAVTAGIQTRVMVGSTGSIAAGSDTWNLSSPGSDATNARVNFTGSGIQTSANGVVSVDTGAAGSVTQFDGTASRAVTTSWGAISYGTGQGVTFNTATRGRINSAVNLTPNLSSGETGGNLSGQWLGNLSVGYSLDVVDNRPIYVANGSINQTAFNGYNFDTISNRIYGGIGSYTNPYVTTQSGVKQQLTNGYYGDEGGQYDMYDTFSTGLGTTGGGSGTRTLTVSPEGLDGERAAYQMSYNWSINRVNQAQMGTSGSLAGSGFHEYAITGEDEQGKQSVGTFSLFQTNAGAGVASAQVSVYDSYMGRGWSMLATPTNPSSSSRTLQFSFDDTGLKNGTYFASATVTAQHANQSIIGSYSNDLGVYHHLFEVVVTGRADNTGYKGFRLTQFDVTSAQVSEGDTSMQILDIIQPNGERPVAMEILAQNGTVKGPNGQTVGFATGEISGLEGMKFVLQSSYNEAELKKTFGTESVAVLLWKNGSGEFVNAVLGNKGDAENGGLTGFAKVGQRFVGSYANYLLSLGTGVAPRLGDYGYDSTNNKVWAVLDHNSQFGGAGAVASGVPEPSTFAILLLSASLAFRRRR